MVLVLTYLVVLFWALTNGEKVLSWLGGILGLLSPLIIGIFIAFMLNPLLNFIENTVIGRYFYHVKTLYRRRRLISVTLIYLITTALLVSIIFFILPQVVQSGQSLINALPKYAQSSYRLIHSILKDLRVSPQDVNEIFGSWEDIFKSLGEFTANAFEQLFHVTMNVASGVINFFMGVIFSIYILLYKEKLKNILHKLTSAFLSERVVYWLEDLAQEIHRTFQKFIGGQLTEAVILGGMCFLGMVALRLPYAPLISLLVGITSLIPLLGAYIGTIPSAFIIFMENPMQALIFILFILIIQQIEGNFIYPRVVGNAIGLDGFWVFLAIFIGGNALGILGMLVAVPSMAVIYTLIRQVTNRRLDSKKGS